MVIQTSGPLVSALHLSSFLRLGGKEYELHQCSGALCFFPEVSRHGCLEILVWLLVSGTRAEASYLPCWPKQIHQVLDETMKKKWPLCCTNEILSPLLSPPQENLFKNIIVLLVHHIKKKKMKSLFLPNGHTCFEGR